MAIHWSTGECCFCYILKTRLRETVIMKASYISYKINVGQFGQLKFKTECQTNRFKQIHRFLV
jgi:predicted DsbA family dithiol-disulfide isomerase